MRLGIQLVNVLAAILVAAPVSAQTYKWVDENGVTNYASSPPSTTKATTKIVTVAERISVYTSDGADARALDASSRNEGALSRRIDRLERQLDAERQARQYAAMAEARASQAAYDSCVAERHVDCDDSGGYYPYGPVIVSAPFQHRRSRFVPLVAVTGVTAGNVTQAIRGGGGGFNGTPGVTKGSVGTFQSLPAARMSRGFPLR